MITTIEFDNAVHIIQAYKLQLEKEVDLKEVVANVDMINIQTEVKGGTFKVLQDYYLDHYNFLISREDLGAMDPNFLSEINLETLLLYRGFGKAKLCRLKEILISKGIMSSHLK
jgi:ribonucleotide reductase beta subunit family protein with ferritin-like domain